uniref:PilS cassette n=1 Tax=Ascaris lumbricoides TaxID=6252 RepID=A0A0M3IFW4_ASCLU
MFKKTGSYEIIGEGNDLPTKAMQTTTATVENIGEGRSLPKWLPRTPRYPFYRSELRRFAFLDAFYTGEEVLESRKPA